MSKTIYTSNSSRGYRYRCKALALFTAITAGAGTTFDARANDIPAEAPIKVVTLYQSGATIVRTNTVSVPSGSHRVVFKDLPANIDVSLVRVMVSSKSVRLGSIDIEKVTQADFVAAREREIGGQIEKLRDELAELDDVIHTAEAQLRVMDTVSFAQSGQTQKPSLDVQNLQGALNTIGTADPTARSRIRDSNIRKRDIDRQIAKLTEELRKIGTNRKDSITVRASVIASAAVNAPVSIAYNVKEAYWQWIYEAHLDSASKHVAIVKQAQVRQGSGEDWNNVSLTLKVGSPSTKNQLAPLSSLYLKSEEPGSYHGGRGRSASASLDEIVVTAQRRSGFFSRRTREPEPEEEPGEYIAMDSNSTEFATDYAVPGSVAIPSDREPRLYPVNEDEFAVDLVARAIPKRELAAYLEATFKYERNTPFQSGELQLFRDDAFIGKAAVETLLPGAEVRLPFGVDERIQIKFRQEEEQSGKRGVFGRQQVKDDRVRFEILNTHSYPIKVEILDRLPIAKSNDVRIEIPQGATPPTQKEFENKPGVMMWSLEVAPRQTATIRHYLEIRYPSDKQLAGYESRD